MCMMPMEKMDMGKDNMGQMDMGDKGRSHEMTGTKGDKTKAEKRVGDLMVAFSTANSYQMNSNIERAHDEAHYLGSAASTT